MNVTDYTDLKDLILDRLFAGLDARSESLNVLSLQISSNPAYLANLRHKRSDIKATTLAMISAKFNLDARWILGVGDAIEFSELRDRSKTTGSKGMFGTQISFDLLLDGWRAANGRLAEMSEAILEAVDVYTEPMMGEMVPVRMGQKSLASQILKTTDTNIFSDALKKTSPLLISRIIDNHYEVMQGQRLLTAESINVVWPNDTVVAYEYDRLMLPVLDDNDRTQILVYSKYVRALEDPSR